MATVKIERRTERFSRTVNGAWSRHVVTETEVLERDEEVLRTTHYEHPLYKTTMPRRFSLNSGITVTWPDGVVEHAYPGNGGVGNYPPHCIPANGRLAALMNA